MTHSCMQHDSFLLHPLEKGSALIQGWLMIVTRLIHTCGMTHLYVRHDSLNLHPRWRRAVLEAVMDIYMYVMYLYQYISVSEMYYIYVYIYIYIYVY